MDVGLGYSPNILDEQRYTECLRKSPLDMKAWSDYSPDLTGPRTGHFRLGFINRLPLAFEFLLVLKDKFENEKREKVLLSCWSISD